MGIASRMISKGQERELFNVWIPCLYKDHSVANVVHKKLSSTILLKKRCTYRNWRDC